MERSRLPVPAASQQLAIYKTLQVCGIPVTLNVNRGNRIVDFLQVARCQQYVRRAKIFFKTVQLCGSRNRHDPGLLRQQPSERNLRLRCFFLFRDSSQRIDQCLVRFARFLGKARNDVAEVRLVELRFFRDGSGEEPLAQRAERHKPDTEFFQCRQDLFLRLAPPQRILTL